jgi:hypothetical protein
MENNKVTYHFEGQCLVHKDNTLEHQKCILEIYYVDSNGNGKDKHILKLGIFLHPKEIPAKCELTILECVDDTWFGNMYFIRFISSVLVSQDTVALNNLITGKRYKSKDIDLSTKAFVNNVYAEFMKISKINVKNEKSILMN